MATVPLGIGAYKRSIGGAPEIKLINRFVEKAPTNLQEHIALLARSGTANLVLAGAGPIRALYSQPGLFNSALFIVSGNSLYRYDTSGVLTQITGTIGGSGFTYAAWMKGIGYEFLFLSDGVSLQYYSTHAMGTLTLTPNTPDGNITNQVITIGGTYYSWAADVNAGTPAGTLAAPYLALLGTASPGVTADSQSLANMLALINFSGLQGYEFSNTVTAANPLVTAANTDTTLVLTALSDNVAGNTVTTTVASGSYLAWGAATLTGGGNQQLYPVPLPNAGETPRALAPIAGYVLVSVGATQKFYYILPGQVTINGLNFASKEQNPDPIVDMATVGDNVFIAGLGAVENWYANQGSDALINPFVPSQGRVYRRGVIDGTVVKVRDAIIFVGDDGVVYSAGYTYGATDQWGVHRISDTGIEERIRTQLRVLQGLPA